MDSGRKLADILCTQGVSFIFSSILSSPLEWRCVRDCNRELRDSSNSPWGVCSLQFNKFLEGLDEDSLVEKASGEYRDHDEVFWSMLHHHVPATVIIKAMRRIVKGNGRGGGDVGIFIRRGWITILMKTLDLEYVKAIPLAPAVIHDVCSLLGELCTPRHLRVLCIDASIRGLKRESSCSVIESRCLSVLDLFVRSESSLLLELGLVEILRNAVKHYFWCPQVRDFVCRIIGGLFSYVESAESHSKLVESLISTNMIKCLIASQHANSVLGQVDVLIWDMILLLLQESRCKVCCEVVASVTAIFKRWSSMTSGYVISSRRDDTMTLLRIVEYIICEQDCLFTISQDLMDKVMDYVLSILSFEDSALESDVFPCLCHIFIEVACDAKWALWLCRRRVAGFIVRGIGSRVRVFSGREPHLTLEKERVMQISSGIVALPFVLFHDRSELSCALFEITRAMDRFLSDVNVQIIACWCIRNLVWDDNMPLVHPECDPVHEHVLRAMKVHESNPMLREEGSGVVVTVLQYYIRHEHGGDGAGLHDLMQALGSFREKEYLRERICAFLDSDDQSMITEIEKTLSTAEKHPLACFF